MELASLLIVAVFVLGYTAIILEHYIKINKTAVALLAAVLCWSVYFLFSPEPVSEDLEKLGHHVSSVAQIIFFLMGAMAVVELVDSHRGFKVITDFIHTTSKRKMLWIIAFVSFFLSSVLDNLTTTILMVSLMRKLVPDREDRFLLNCIVVVAANAGGAWTPIGDVTTTMLWIGGQLSSVAVMKALFIPSLIALVVPLAYYTFRLKGKYPVRSKALADEKPEPGARLVFWVGIGALMFVPIFKAWTGLPPFMGVLVGLALLWLITDLLHNAFEQRSHLRLPHILSRIDTPGVLFFLGILLAVNALETAGLLNRLASWLDAEVQSQAVLATLIGLFSAIVDNVPLVAATMGMYSLADYGMDASLWHMIAYAAGTGGSILIIGSAAGVALMGMEKVDFVSYFKKAAFPTLLGYLAGMAAYLLLNA
jgi:NhaD family Na+/H+ antiporter